MTLARGFTALSLSFLICTMGIITAPSWTELIVSWKRPLRACDKGSHRDPRLGLMLPP